MEQIIKSGFYDLPSGHIAAVVTSLEMRTKPPLRAERTANQSTLQPWHAPHPDEYLNLFRQIGADWLWFSRLTMREDELTAIIHDPEVEIYRITAQTGTGLLELDFRQEGECELAFFGLTSELQGQGAGRWLMNRAIERAWSKPIKRFWVHTCSMDHPGALGFYRRSGFTPYHRQVEVAPDPRLSGILPRTAAPHIPLLKD